MLAINSIYFVSDGMSFLYGCISGYGCDYGNENDAPVNCRNSNEKQNSGQLIGYSMREAEPFDDDQGLYLIDNLDDDDDSCPDP